jgi:hypothetical protein
MPKVGNKNFEYSEAGMKAAKAEAKRTGKPIQGAVKRSLLKKGGKGMKGSY